MSPFMRYSLARVGIFVLVAGGLFLVPIQVDPLLRLMVALLLSAILAYLLLGRLRVQVGEQVAGVAQRRADRKERLRSALAGEDTPDDAAH